ncbi:MAG: cytochrome c [Pirellulales bacterium]
MEDALLDELDVEFQSVVEIPPLAEAMVALEHTNDHVKAIAAADWRTPADHPDLDPAHEALLLREHFTEMLRVDEVRSQPEEFQAMLRESEESARRLETALRRWQPAAGVAPPEAVTAPFARITANCKACHEKYRDVPLSEK